MSDWPHCFVVVDMRAGPERSVNYHGEWIPRWRWRVIGDGKTLEQALACAREQEHVDSGACQHCGRTRDDEDEMWRVYPIERAAWEMLTCGGPYEDAIRPRGDITWCEGTGAFVYLDDADCIRCRGDARLPLEGPPPPAHAIDPWEQREERAQCTLCDGDGYVARTPQKWCKPPKGSAVWRGTPPKVKR